MGKKITLTEEQLIDLIERTAKKSIKVNKVNEEYDDNGELRNFVVDGEITCSVRCVVEATNEEEAIEKAGESVEVGNYCGMGDCEHLIGSDYDRFTIEGWDPQWTSAEEGEL